MIFPKPLKTRPRPSWQRACLCLCLTILLIGCGPRQIVRPEPVETERRVWVPVPADRVSPLPYLEPPTTLGACLVEFAPAAYTIIEQCNRDRKAVRNLEEPEDGT